MKKIKGKLETVVKKLKIKLRKNSAIELREWAIEENIFKGRLKELIVELEKDNPDIGVIERIMSCQD